MKKRIKKKKQKAAEALAAETVAEKETAEETDTALPAAPLGDVPDAPPAEETAAVTPTGEEASPLDRLRPGERAALIAALATRMRREEEDALLAELASEEACADIAQYAERMRALPTRFPFLATLPVRDRLTAAYHMCRGLEAVPRTAEEKLEELFSDPAMLAALSEKFSRLLAARRDATPPVPVRSGTAVPPADRRPSPRDLREASVAAKRYLGVKEN